MKSHLTLRTIKATHVIVIRMGNNFETVQTISTQFRRSNSISFALSLSHFPFPTPALARSHQDSFVRHLQAPSCILSSSSSALVQTTCVLSSPSSRLSQSLPLSLSTPLLPSLNPSLDAYHPLSIRCLLNSQTCSLLAYLGRRTLPCSVRGTSVRFDRCSTSAQAQLKPGIISPRHTETPLCTAIGP
jgi:hypothetical protein